MTESVPAPPTSADWYGMGREAFMAAAWTTRSSGTPKPRPTRGAVAVGEGRTSLPMINQENGNVEMVEESQPQKALARTGGDRVFSGELCAGRSGPW